MPRAEVWKKAPTDRANNCIAGIPSFVISAPDKEVMRYARSAVQSKAGTLSENASSLSAEKRVLPGVSTVFGVAATLAF